MTTPHRPTTDVDTESWWASVQDRNLTVVVCGSCGRKSLYVRPFCPHCWSEDVSTVRASGRATLYTWTVVRQNVAPFDITPYVVAIVELIEGPRLMTAIEECPLDALEAGLQLIVHFRTDDDGFVVPVFHPAR